MIKVGRAGRPMCELDVRVPIFHGPMANPLTREYRSDGPMLLIGAGPLPQFRLAPAHKRQLRQQGLGPAGHSRRPPGRDPPRRMGSTRARLGRLDSYRVHQGRPDKISYVENASWAHTRSRCQSEVEDL